MKEAQFSVIVYDSKSTLLTYLRNAENSYFEHASLRLNVFKKRNPTPKDTVLVGEQVLAEDPQSYIDKGMQVLLLTTHWNASLMNNLKSFDYQWVNLNQMIDTENEHVLVYLSLDTLDPRLIETGYRLAQGPNARLIVISVVDYEQDASVNQW